jgi:hypothetical protein
LARDLGSGFQEKDIHAWLDEADLPFGNTIKTSIHENIEKSDFFLLLWSDSAAISQWVAFEIDVALASRTASGRPEILPIVLADNVALPPRISPFKFITYRADPHFLLAEVMLRIGGANWKSLLPMQKEIRRQTCLIKQGTFLHGPGRSIASIDYDFLMDTYPVSRRKFFSFCFFGGYQDLANCHARARLFMESTKQYYQLLNLSPIELISKRFRDFPILHRN